MPPPRARVVGPGRAGGSFQQALERVGWTFDTPRRRGDRLDDAARHVDVLILATPDGVVADVARAVVPVDTTVVVHLSGSLGISPLRDHPRRAVVHPLVALPDPDRGADRLEGAWFGLSAEGDELGRLLVDDLRGHPVTVLEDDWARYHAAAVIAANHLVALMGQAERVGASVGLPLAALMDLARGSLADVADLGPAAALTGPVRRGDLATVERHLAALPATEREAYRALSEQAGRLVADDPADRPASEI